ncbi:MAG TPA: glycosyltransferase family 4 protein, partial [Gemmatimonadaceae bacterium]|nr:glycosyltransferase family 4 protein [Gemmatimonadaceae bacterium]
YEYALDAVALLVERGLVLEYTILGEGDYREAIVFAARQHGLLQRGIVRLLGAVPREEVVDHYRHAHVLLHAAVDEGFCNSVLEAQAMQLPVVASDAGGLPENLADGITGFIVPRRDVRAMADRMWQLAHDPVLYEKLSAAGRERVAERFELGRQIAGFVALYRELSQYFIARQQ